jgi:bifunctional DNA-binding transcriptional regulator/antitoxin component of YhaV-PrlF toxin-antitoxin module
MTNTKETVLGQGKVTHRNQVQVITEVRPHLNIKPGDTIEYVLTANGDVLIRKSEGSKRQ